MYCVRFAILDKNARRMSIEGLVLLAPVRGRTDCIRSRCRGFITVDKVGFKRVRSGAIMSMS